MILSFRKIFLLTVVFSGFAFSACFSPWEGDTAKITLVMGDSAYSGRTAMVWPPDTATLNRLTYVINLSGQPGIRTISANGNQTIEAVVDPGFWTISVEAFLEGDIYASGSASSLVHPGQNNFVQVEMNQAFDDNTIMVPGARLAVKLDWLRDNAVNGGFYIIDVDADEVIAPQTLKYDGKDNITLRLRGAGSKRNIRLTKTGSLFTVSSGVTLILDENITLHGLRGQSFLHGNTGPVVKISGGTLVMNSGAVITGNYYPGSGGGVSVVQGTFVMNGGSITDNTTNGFGAGVYLEESSFTMNGGLIERNTIFFSPAVSSFNGGGGGVFVGAGSRFVKTGDSIITGIDDTVNGNAVKNSFFNPINGKGHAVLVIDTTTTLSKDTTSGSRMNLSYAPDTGESGSWD